MPHMIRRKQKRRFLLWAGALLLVVALGATFLFACSGSVKTDSVPPSNSLSISLTPPTDGSKPGDHTALENVGYIIGRLSSRSCYHTDTVGTVSAKVGLIAANQDIIGTKDYKEGILITSSISLSHSTFVSSRALQKFFGDETVVVRSAASDSDADWAGKDTEWATGEPDEILNAEQYEERYGLWADEFSDYVINEETLLSSTDIVCEDGVYTMTISLDPEGSTYYYKKNMCTMGNLKQDPTFETVELTLRYTEDWTILSYEINEKYDTVMGVTAKCTGNSTITFSYEEADVDVSAYESYFVEYANAAPTGAADAEMGVTDYLAEGFGFALSGENAFAVHAVLEGIEVDGTAVLAMQDMQLTGLRFNLGGEDGLDLLYEGDMLYVRYDGAFGKIAVSDLGGLLGGNAGGAGLDTDALMSQIMNGTITKDGTSVTVDCPLNLLGMDLGVQFRFTEEGNSVNFESLSATVDLGSLIDGLDPVRLSVVRAEGVVSLPELDTDDAVDLKPFAEQIAQLIEGKNYRLTVAYDGEFSLNGTLDIVLTDGIALQADLTVGYGKTTVPVAVKMIGNEIFLDVYGLHVAANTDELGDVIGALLGSADGASLPQNVKLDVAALLASLKEIDLGAVLQGVTLTGSGFGVTVDADALLPVLGSIAELPENLKLGMFTANYDAATNSLTADILGATLTFAAGNAAVQAPTEAERAEYVTIARILEYVEKIGALIESKNYRLTFSYDGEFSLDGRVDIVLTDGVALQANLTVTYGKTTVPVSVKMIGEEIFLDVYDLHVCATADDLTELLGGLLGGTDGAALPQGIDLDVAGLLASLKEIDLGAVLRGVVLTDKGFGVTVDADALRPLLGSFVELPVDLKLGTFTANYDVATNSLTAGILGATLTFAAANAEVQAPTEAERAEYVTIARILEYAEKIGALIESKNYRLTVAYAGEFSLNGTVDIVLTDGVVLQADLTVSYGDLTVPVTAKMIGEEIFLDVYGLRVAANLDELTDVLGELLGDADGTSLPQNVKLDVAALLASLKEIDLGAVLQGITLTDSGFGASVDADALLPLLGSIAQLPENLKLGTITADYDAATNSLTAGILGATLTFAAGNAAVQAPTEAERAEYVAAARLLAFIDPIRALLASDQFAFAAHVELILEGNRIVADLDGNIWLKDGMQAYLQVNAGNLCVEILYTQNGVRIACDGYYFDVSQSDLTYIAEQVSEMLPDGGSDLSDIASLLDTLDISALLRSLRLAESDNALQAVLDLAALMGGEENLLSFTLQPTLEKDGVVLSLDALTVSGVTLENVGLQVSAADSAVPAVGQVGCESFVTFLLNAFISATSDNGVSRIVADLTYASDALSVDADGAIELVREENNSVTLNLQVRAAVLSGADSHYIELTVLGETVYMYYSTVGFEGTANASPLRYSIPVSELFVTAGTVWPLIGSLVGVGDTAYYYNFVSTILNGYEEMGEYYTTINSDIFGLPLYGDKSAVEAWVDIFLGIAKEYGGKESAPAKTEKSSDLSFGFDAEKSEIVLSGTGLNASIRINAEGGIAAPEGAYTSLASLSRLAQVLMNSITTEKQTVAPDGSVAQTAAINEYYYLTGEVTGSIIGINLASIDVAVSVMIDEDAGVSVNIRLAYSKGIAFKADTVFEMTIEKGMVYMVRTASSETLYRVMPLDNFLGGILDHLTFMFNFTDMIAGMIPSSGEDSDSGNAADLGAIVTSFAYSGSENAGENWTIGLDLSSVTNDALGSTQVSLNAGADGMLHGLNLSSSLGGVLNLGATLNYNNPGAGMGDPASTGDKTRTVSGDLSVLCGKAIAETDWTQVPFIEAKIATLTYTVDGAAIGSQKVAYNTANGAVLTVLALPDLAPFNAGGYTYSWGAVGSVNGDAQYAAQKTPNVYTVYVYSEYEIEGLTYADRDGDMFVYEFAYTYGTRLELPVGARAGGMYAIDRFVDETGKGMTVVEGITEDVVLTAEWDLIRYTVTYTVFGETVGEQKYYYGDAVAPLEYVEGYGEVVWASIPEIVTEDVTIEAAQAAVTVTLASDYMTDGFVSGEGGYYKEVTLSGSSLQDFAASYDLTLAGYTQFGWWSNVGGWQNITSFAGLDGETVWTVWISNTLNVELTTVTKSAGSTWTFAGTYSAIADGTVSKTIADAVGISSTANVRYYINVKPLLQSVRNDWLNSGNPYTVSGGTFETSGMTSFYGISGKVYYGGVEAEATYSYNGLTATASGSATKDY